MRVGFGLSALAVGIAFAACAGTAATAQNFTMKFGHRHGQRAAARIHQVLQGRDRAAQRRQDQGRDLSASQLGPIPRQIEGLQLGTIEAFIGPADFYVGVDKRFGVFSAPILFGDRKNAAATLADAELNKAILALGADKGLVGIGTFAYAQHDYLAKDPIRSCRLQGQADPRQRHAD